MSKPESLRNTVYRYLIEKIQTGELMPGDKVNESVICNGLSLSRTPTREALIKLESEGFLMYTPNKGFTVTKIDEKSRNDVYVIIGTLDALVVSLAINNITDNDFLRMNELVDKMDVAIKYQNFPDYSKYQNEFHDVYLSKCNNDRLITILRDLRSTFVPQTYINGNKCDLFANLKVSNDDHRHIIELFRKNDLQKLQEFLKNRHWQNVFS